MNSNKTGLKASTGEGGGSVSIFKLPLNWRDWEIVSYVYGEGGGVRTNVDIGKKFRNGKLVNFDTKI